jgi:hypothetical protein
MGRGATSLPVRGIVKNCLIVNFATAVAVAMAMHSVSPATNGGDGFNKSTNNPSPCAAAQHSALVRLRTRH